MASTAAALLRVAASQIGYREGRDPNGNWNNINKFGAWYAEQINNRAFNGVAWCDEFVSWCAAQSGNGDIIPLSAYVPGRLAWARSKGLSGHYPPAPGDIGIVNEPVYGGNGRVVDRYIHVFIVEKYLGGGRVQTIEGNTNDNGSAQGNGVYRLIRQDSETSNRYIYIRPQYAAEATPAPAPAPAPKPVVKPVPKPAPTGPRIKVSNIRPGRRNEDVRLFNALLWNRMGPKYKAANQKAWNGESADLYGPVAQRVCLYYYGALHRADPKNWGPPPAAPVWPGPSLIRHLGATPV